MLNFGPIRLRSFRSWAIHLNWRNLNLHFHMMLHSKY